LDILESTEIISKKLNSRPLIVNEDPKILKQTYNTFCKNCNTNVSYFPKKFTFSGYYQNVRGLRTKLCDLNCNIPLIKVKYFILTETWLGDDISNKELGFDNYNIYRTDRSIMTSICTRGVAVSVHKSFYLLSSKIINIQDNSIEQIYVLVTLNAKLKCIFGVYYIPPISNISSYIEHTNTIEWLLSNTDTHTNIIWLWVSCGLACRFRCWRPVNSGPTIF